ncbi:Holliday junction branch migration protein RuvA [Candidatus Aerophobetes bacterium]|nr:Holliday junction branch migration protein RuvA [Candidatus Aerophobetes bacterium]
MIYYLEGTLKEKNPSWIILEANGVGYQINIPFSLFEYFPSRGEKVKVYTYLRMKDDAVALYGFLTTEDREFFLHLISLSSIGPRSALRMLSRTTPLQLKQAIIEKNLAQLTQTPGIGKKTAQRLVLELEDIAGEKIPLLREDKVYQDGLAALASLGYTRNRAEEAIRKAMEKNSGLKNDLAGLIKEALRYV